MAGNKDNKNDTSPKDTGEDNEGEVELPPYMEKLIQDITRRMALKQRAKEFGLPTAQRGYKLRGVSVTRKNKSESKKKKKMRKKSQRRNRK